MFELYLDVSHFGSAGQEQQGVYNFSRKSVFTSTHTHSHQYEHTQILITCLTDLVK